MILYYITDLTQFPGSDAERRRALLAKIAEAGRTGIDFIQLRERDLSARELEQLATATMETLRLAPATRLLINSRIDVALAVGAHGVHLRADDITAAEARGIWLRAKTTKPVIAVSCHSVEEVALATRLLIHSRIDVALAVGAHGVHLRADDITAAEARGIWLRAKTTKPVI